MGEVYEVQDRFLQGVHVALKMILPQISGDVGSLRRFEQEVLVARKLVHPHLCPIYDIGRCDTPAPPFAFFTMKLLEGETLSARLKREPELSRAEKEIIFRQMVAGLAAIHAQGVIHRDIKPNNVMLSGRESELCLSIMDFGLARVQQPDVTLSTLGIGGTPGYLAPELYHQAAASEASDIYALGVLLHQVFTGEHPAWHSTGGGTGGKDVLDRADAAPEAIAAVREFLADDPERRRRAFAQVREGRTAVGSGVTALRPEQERLRWLSRRSFVAGSAAAACAAGGLAVWKRGWVWERMEDVLHPLPAKRFVALLGWPPATDAALQATIAGVVDTIGNELARAEAFDRNLFISPPPNGEQVTTLAQLTEVRESLGANLVLSASAWAQRDVIRVELRVLDANGRTLRERAINAARSAALTLPGEAVQVAARLLDITSYRADTGRSKVGTNNPAAYAAFQAGEGLKAQENDTGLDEAVKKYKEAIELDPQFAVAQTRLAWAYLRSYALHSNAGELSLAEANARAAIRTNPDLVDAHVALGSVYQQRGDSDRAALEYKKALALDPADSHTLIYQSRLLAANGKWPQAESKLQQVISMRPNYWLAYNDLGMLYNQQGKYEEALKEFRAASVAAPKNALALANVGGVCLALGKWQEAMESFNKSYQLKADDEAAIGLAVANRVLGNVAAAVGFAEDAVKLNPAWSSDWVELGDCYARLPNGQRQAAAAFARARNVQAEKVKNEPKNGPEWMSMALCDAKTNDARAADAAMERAGTLGGDDVDSELTRIRILFLLRRNEEGLTTIADVLKRGGTVYQLQAMPELEKMRADAPYRAIIGETGPGT